MLKNAYKNKPGSWRYFYDLTQANSGVWEKGNVGNNLCGMFYELVMLVL